MDARSHVFDVDVHKTITPMADLVGDRQLALAVEVADVDREPQQVGLSAGRVEFGEEIGVAGECVDEHAGLGFEAEDDVLVGGVGQDFDQAGGEAVHCFAIPCPVFHGPGPKRNAIGVECGGDVDRPRKEVDASGASGWFGGNERRLVLDVRIEQETSAGFDNATHFVLLEKVSRYLKLIGKILGKGI